MINDNTILSSFDDKPTLLEWLKKVEDALKTDTAKSISVENPSANTYVFKITFADGTTLSSGNVVFPDSVKDVTIKNGHIIVTQISGTQTDLGELNPYRDVILINRETNTTEIGNNVEIDGDTTINSTLSVGGSIESGYNYDGSMVISNNVPEGITFQQVDGVNFVREKDGLVEIHGYMKMVKSSGSYATLDLLSIYQGICPSHDHTYLVPFGTENGSVTGYMYAVLYQNGKIRLGDWNGIPNQTRYIYIDFMYFKH